MNIDVVFPEKASPGPLPCVKVPETPREPEPQRTRRFGNVGKGRIVKREFFKARTAGFHSRLLSTGIDPRNTMGLTSLYPSTAPRAPLCFVVIVSPILRSDTGLDIGKHVAYPRPPPARPAERGRAENARLRKLQILSGIDHMDHIAGLIVPEKIRTYATAPLKESKSESKIRAVSRSSDAARRRRNIGHYPFEYFRHAFTAFRRWHRRMPSGGTPKRSPICLPTSSAWDDGRSILFMTGIISKSFSSARYTLVSGLRFDTLACVNHQDRAFARGKRPGDLVRKIQRAPACLSG